MQSWESLNETTIEMHLNFLWGTWVHYRHRKHFSWDDSSPCGRSSYIESFIFSLSTIGTCLIIQHRVEEWTSIFSARINTWILISMEHDETRKIVLRVLCTKVLEVLEAKPKFFEIWSGVEIVLEMIEKNLEQLQNLYK